jgi:hypothetical protein
LFGGVGGAHEDGAAVFIAEPGEDWVKDTAGFLSGAIAGLVSPAKAVDLVNEEHARRHLFGKAYGASEELPGSAQFCCKRGMEKTSMTSD